MSAKYRVKLENNRIVGPFSPAQIAELFGRGHITENSPCQEFPTGDWLTVASFEPIKKSILKSISGNNEITQTSSEATVVRMMLPKKKTNKKLQEKLSETPSSPSEEGAKDEDTQAPLSEFKFEREAVSNVDYEELEKRYQEKKKEESEVADAVPSLEKTRVLNRSMLKAQLDDGDATRVIKPLEPLVDKEPDGQDQLKEKIEEKALQIKENDIAEEAVDSQEATQFINVGGMLPSLHQEAVKAENEIVILAKQASLKNEAKDNSEEETAQEDDENSDKKKKMKPVVAIAFLAIFWFLFFDEGEKQAAPIAPQRTAIVFPSQAEFMDEVKAKQSLAQGLAEYEKQTYLSLVKSSQLFRQSLFHKFQDNPALGYLILAYSRLYPNAKNKLEASTTLFNLVRVAQDRVLTDANVAIGTAEFYLNAGKPLTAVNIIENYLRVSKKPTVTMLSVYLDSLVKAGRLSDSKDAFDRLKDLQTLPIEAYANMADYLEFDEKIAEAKEMVERGLKSSPNSVRLLLKKADYLLREGNLDGYRAVLQEIEELQAEQCPSYYAAFLQHMGNASVLGGKTELATKFYRESLNIMESSELRTRLANLSVGGSDAAQALIKESKIHELMKKSRFAMKEYDWESAFVFAIEASDMNPLDIAPNLLLVDIQVKRGYYSAALNTLQRLKKRYPIDVAINSRLVETYLATFKLNDAISTINEFAQSEAAVNTPAYASMLGRYYASSGNDAVAIKWLSEAVNRDPLRDQDIFMMARIYVKNGKYNDGKLMLSKALTLDPINVEYQSLYAQILYDQDGADTAIGYLRDMLQNNKDSPKILGEIAKYYYKSGQIKEFNIYREQVESLGQKDENFYRFMIYASELNQKPEKVLEYGRELVKINPGDIVTHMKIGEYLAKLGSHDRALEAYEQVKQRLDNYPKINYMMAKSYMAMGNFDKALEFAQLEIQSNPKLPDGYFIVGEVYAEKKDYAQAVKNYEKAVTIDYSYVEGLLALGGMKRRQNSHEQARELLHRALKIEPNNALIHRELGHVYRAVGQGRMAVEFFETYLTLFPSAGDRSQIEALIRASQ